MYAGKWSEWSLAVASLAPRSPRALCKLHFPASTADVGRDGSYCRELTRVTRLNPKSKPLSYCLELTRVTREFARLQQ